jgi:hypothetical protein
MVTARRREPEGILAPGRIVKGLRTEGGLAPKLLSFGRQTDSLVTSAGVGSQ